jgi:acetyl-CoA C-acetyltransferase
VIGLMKGLTDPVVGLLMGQTAENLAWKFGIDRGRWTNLPCAATSAPGRRQAGHFAEIVPLVDGDGKVYAEDDGVRADASMAGMAKLEAVLRQEVRQHHRRQQLADHRRRRLGAAGLGRGGAKWGLQAARQDRRQPVGRAGTGADGPRPGACDDADPAAPRPELADIDAGNSTKPSPRRCWLPGSLARRRLLPRTAGPARRLRQIDDERLNVDGGAVAIGHPVGASGARIVLHLLHVLRRNNAKRGVATICIGGGLGGAMLVETCQ